MTTSSTVATLMADTRTRSEKFPRKLGMAEPDLTVILKYHGKDGTPLETEYAMYSHILAYHSGYADAMLSNDMTEKNNMTVTFEDIRAENFHIAMGMLEVNALSFLNKNLPHVFDVRLQIPDMFREISTFFYDKYDFLSGVEMVGFFLEKLFLDARSPNLTDSTIVELCSVAMVVAENGSMLKATQRIKDWLEKVQCRVARIKLRVYPSQSFKRCALYSYWRDWGAERFAFE
jgi:BTB/POZ domain